MYHLNVLLVNKKYMYIFITYILSHLDFIFISKYWFNLLKPNVLMYLNDFYLQMYALFITFIEFL